MLGFDINIRYVPDFPVGGLTFFIGVTLSSRLTFPIYGEKSEPENRICVCNAAATIGNIVVSLHKCSTAHEDFLLKKLGRLASKVRGGPINRLGVVNGVFILSAFGL